MKSCLWDEIFSGKIKYGDLGVFVVGFLWNMVDMVCLYQQICASLTVQIDRDDYSWVREENMASFSVLSKC